MNAAYFSLQWIKQSTQGIRSVGGIPTSQKWTFMYECPDFV